MKEASKVGELFVVRVGCSRNWVVARKRDEVR